MPLEDYEQASPSRQTDVETLLINANQRTTAAVPLGGIAVECKLKALIIKYHNIGAWDDCSRRKKDPKLGQGISRPGHSLFASVKLMDGIYRKAKTDPLFLMHLERIMHPAGATASDFIELRYSASDIDEASINDWQQSFRYVMGWLLKNEDI